MDFLKDFLFTDSKILFAIIGGIIGYSFKLFLNWVNNRQVYRDQYYGKLTDKQFSAYKPVEDILQMLNLKGETKDKKLYHTFFKNIDSYNIFLRKFNEMGVANYLLGTELVKEIHIMNKFLLDIKGELLSVDVIKTNKDDYVVQYVLIGVNHHEKLNSYFLRIQKMLLEDFVALHKVRKFMRKRANQISDIIHNKRTWGVRMLEYKARLQNKILIRNSNSSM